METKTTTFYAVRVICIRMDGKPGPTRWVCQSWNHKNQYSLTSGWMGVSRFDGITAAKRALGYAIVRDALKSEYVVDADKRASLEKKYGNRYNPHWHGSGNVRCRYEAEAVRIVETITYSEPEVIDALPKRSALEQIARQAEN